MIEPVVDGIDPEVRVAIVSGNLAHVVAWADAEDGERVRQCCFSRQIRREVVISNWREPCWCTVGWRVNTRWLCIRGGTGGKDQLGGILTLGSRAGKAEDEHFHFVDQPLID